MTKTMHVFFALRSRTFVCCISEIANRKANYSETAPVTMETTNEASFSIYIATAYQKWLTEKFCEITVFEKETYNCQFHYVSQYNISN